jgi:SAM-dependent methyltransferase
MLESLHARARGRRLARVLDAATDGRLAAAPPPPEPPPPPPAPDPLPILGREPVARPADRAGRAVTDALWSRLPPGSEDALVAAIADDYHLSLAYRTAPGVDRRRLGLALMLHAGVPGVAEATGLRAAMPPAEVHAMAHTPHATGGPIVYGDILEAAFAAVGAPLAAGATVLDFGCSSGRVVRVLHAWEPGLDLLGCDPNGPAVAWAREHLPGIRFATSPTAPPLDLPDASVDAAFAISIWSHFDAGPARAWLDELARVVRPGGHLLLTTQGWQSVAYFARLPGHALEDQRPIAHDLYVDGFAFVDTFGAEGDWGVPSDGWGTAFLTAEWLGAVATPRWSIALARPGAIEGNQDLYVLRRAV